MEKFTIEIQEDEALEVYEVIDYAHGEDNKCKFEIFKAGKLAASFEPDSKGFLHVCKNPGNLNEITLEHLAEKIEFYNF